MDNIDYTQRRPSLYVAIILAKLVYNFRDRLRMKVQSNKSLAINSSTSELNHFERYNNTARMREVANDCSKAQTQAQMCTNHGNNLERSIDHEQLTRHAICSSNPSNLTEPEQYYGLRTKILAGTCYCAMLLETIESF